MGFNPETSKLIRKGPNFREYRNSDGSHTTIIYEGEPGTSPVKAVQVKKEVDDETTALTNADTYANYNTPDATHGSEIYIRTQGVYWGNQKIAYWKFDLSSIPEGANVVDAYFRAYVWGLEVGNASHETLRAVSDTAWDEATLCWNNKPALGTALKTLFITSIGRWWDWTDLEGYVNGKTARRGNDGLRILHVFGIERADAHRRDVNDPYADL